MKRSLAFLLAGMVGAGVIATLASWHGSFDRPPKYPVVAQKPAIRGPTPVQIIEEKRKVYPYSIIAGGARTVEEARRAMSDPAVRDHYGAFDLTKLKQVVLTADMSGYVSYRFGDKIFWTSQTVHLKAGETVFTDGQHIARGRCLNCYSAYPMMPTRPHEPAEVIMDTSVEVPIIALTSPHLPLEEAPVLPAPGGVTTVSGGSAAVHHGGKFFPIIPFIPPLHRHHPNPPNVVPPPTPPTTVVPEPRYNWIVPATALLLVFWGRNWKRRRLTRPGSPL